MIVLISKQENLYAFTGLLLVFSVDFLSNKIEDIFPPPKAATRIYF